MASYYTILTSVGQAKVANAVALGQKVNLSTLAVGDANGVTPQPDANAKALVHERRRAPLNRVEVDEDNPNFIVCEQVLPPEVGGWEIREIGVFDDEGNLIAYGNYPPTYKPLINEGTSRTQTVRMMMQVSDAAAITLKVDPSIVLATREYVDDVAKKNVEALKGIKDGLGTAASMSHTNIGIEEIKGSHEEVADTVQLVQLREKLTKLNDSLKAGSGMSKSDADITGLAGNGNEVATTKQLVQLRNNTITDIRLLVLYKTTMLAGRRYGENDGEIVSFLSINGAVDGSEDYIEISRLQFQKNGVWYTARKGAM